MDFPRDIIFGLIFSVLGWLIIRLFGGIDKKLESIDAKLDKKPDKEIMDAEIKLGVAGHEKEYHASRAGL